MSRTRQHKAARSPVCASTFAISAYNTDVNRYGLNPVFEKKDTGETQVYIPFDSTPGYAFVAEGTAETMMNLSRLFAAAARFAEGDDGPDLRSV